MSSRRFPRGSESAGVKTRLLALKCLAAIDEGGFVQPTLVAFGLNELENHDRRLLREIVMGVQRHRSWLESQVTPYLKTSIEDIDLGIRQALRLGTFQLLKLSKVPNHAAVSTTVEAYKRLYGRKAAGLVNAVLRAVLRSPIIEARTPITAQEIAQHYSQPLWLAQRWCSLLGETEARRFCEILNQPAPLVIRPTQRGAQTALHQRLETEGGALEPGQWTAYSSHLSHPAPFSAESFRKGLWTAQDEASQIVCEVLCPEKGERIWDMCAAPGGKTNLLHWLTDNKIECLATDANPKKVEQLKATLAQTPAQVKDHDARLPLPEANFDRILLDAPCSALGVIRRHPEIKWRRQPKDIAEAAVIQSALLDNAALHLKVGGVLVYSVCSPLPEEGTAQIEQFLEKHPNFELDRPAVDSIKWGDLWDGNGILLLPHKHNTDGFFISRLKRKA